MLSRFRTLLGRDAHVIRAAILNCLLRVWPCSAFWMRSCINAASYSPFGHHYQTIHLLEILFVGCYSDRLHINTVGVAGNKLERIKLICFISFVVFIIVLICGIILHLNNIKLNQMHPNVTENVRLIKTHPTMPSHHCTVIVCCQIYLYLNWKQRVQAPLWSLGIPGLWKCLACQESDINWERVWSENNSR